MGKGIYKRSNPLWQQKIKLEIATDLINSGISIDPKELDLLTSDGLKAMNHIVSAIKQEISRNGYNLVNRVRIAETLGGKDGKDFIAAAGGQISPSTGDFRGVLFVNPAYMNLGMARLNAMAKVQVAKGHWAKIRTPSFKNNIFLHEYGHIVQHYLESKSPNVPRAISHLQSYPHPNVSRKLNVWDLNRIVNTGNGVSQYANTGKHTDAEHFAESYILHRVGGSPRNYGTHFQTNGRRYHRAFTEVMKNEGIKGGYK